MQTNSEKLMEVQNGWVMLIVNLLILLGGLALTITLIRMGGPAAGLLLTIPMIVLGGFLMGGVFTLEPNEARVLILFGKYMGTSREAGFRWSNPL